MPDKQQLQIDAKTPGRRRLRKVRWLAIIVACAFFLFCLATWFIGNSLIAPANQTVGPPPNDLNAISTTLASDSGSKIATWYIPAAGSQATVILLHPIRGDRRSMLGRARLLHDAGYSVVMIDFQAHGDSPGKHITVGYLEQHDVRAAVEFARKSNPHHRIGIVGWSLGGAATLLASPLGVDAVVLESVYPTISEAVHDRIAMRLGPLTYVLSPALLIGLQIRSGISPSDLRPIDHIAEIGCPVLVLTGDADEHTKFAESQRLFDAAREPKKFVVFRGASHTDLLAYDSKLYRNDVISFLAKFLRRADK